MTLEAFGIDAEQTIPSWYERTDDGEKRLIPLSEALTTTVFDAAFQMGERVATGRIVAAIEKIARGEA